MEGAQIGPCRVLGDLGRGGMGAVYLTEVKGKAPGLGKTRLVDGFVGRRRNEGADPNLLLGSYPPGGAPPVAGAFLPAYREHFGEEPLTENSLQTVFMHATRGLAAVPLHREIERASRSGRTP